MPKPGPDWAALGRVFSRLGKPHEELPSAAGLPSPAANDWRNDPELARDLAEERAAIMEFDGGLSRAEAEARAFAAYELLPPKKNKGAG
jgi:hypothetical protein